MFPTSKEYHNWVLRSTRAAKVRVDYWAKFGRKYSEFVWLFRSLSEECILYHILRLKEGSPSMVGLDKNRFGEEIAVVRRTPQSYLKLVLDIESMTEKEFGEKVEIYENALTLYSISN